MNPSLFLSKCHVAAYDDKENHHPNVGYITKSDVFLLLEVFSFCSITKTSDVMLLHPKLGICYVFGYITDGVPNWAELIGSK
jgi:hypothetical protein